MLQRWTTGAGTLPSPFELKIYTLYVKFGVPGGRIPVELFFFNAIINFAGFFLKFEFARQEFFPKLRKWNLFFKKKRKLSSSDSIGWLWKKWFVVIIRWQKIFRFVLCNS